MSVQAIGEPVRREEDLRLLRGRGRYVDDAGAAGDARGYVLRSPHAHARILAIDTGRARHAPGVLAVLTGEELQRARARHLDARRAAPTPQRSARPSSARSRSLPQGRVRYVGDPVAFVVADTLDQAKDAAELIQTDYEPLPAVDHRRRGAGPGRACGLGRQPGQRGILSRGRQQGGVRRRVCPR